ncbi:Tetratricopeptide repeat protein [Pelomyxa schiedti]|nr:Tetratricopeptide repeat protein [Pelomyxa schiedti]
MQGFMRHASELDKYKEKYKAPPSVAPPPPSPSFSSYSGMACQTSGVTPSFSRAQPAPTPAQTTGSPVSGFRRTPTSKPTATKAKAESSDVDSLLACLEEGVVDNATPPSMLPGEISQALKKLEEVHTAGFITDEQYQERKQQLESLVPLKTAPIPKSGNWVVNRRSRSAMKKRQVRVFLSSTFLDMQGERDELLKNVFPKIKEQCAKRGIFFSEVDLRWGITAEQSESGDVLSICLNEIDKCRPFFISLIGDRYGWVPDTIKPDILQKYPFISQLGTPRSVTEMEILYGALNDVESASRALFYMRNNPNISETGDNPEKMRDLKHRIRISGLPLKFYNQPGDLAKHVLKDLSDSIANEFPEDQDPDPLDAQNSAHSAYAETKKRNYLWNSEVYESLCDKLRTSESGGILVVGPAGIGKASFLSNWRERFSHEQGNEIVVSHYIGCTNDRALNTVVVLHIMQTIKREFEIVDEVPADPKEMLREFPRWLTFVPQSCRLIVILDGAHRLENRESALEMRWIPEEIPPQVKFIISMNSSSEPHIFLNNRGWPTMYLQGFSEQQKTEYVQNYLSEYGKSFTLSQMQRITRCQQTDSPLFLRALLEELRLFGVYEQLDSKIDWYLGARTPEELFKKIILRLENDYTTQFVQDTLCSIYCSRMGLSEKEIMGVTGATQMQLSQLLMAVSEYVSSKSGLLCFFHEYMSQAVQSYYLESKPYLVNDYRQKLVAYFSSGPGNADKGRKADELPWLLSQTNPEQLPEALTDLEVFLQLYTQTRRYELKHYWLMVHETTVGECMRRAVDNYNAQPAQVGKMLNKVARFLREMLDYATAKALLRRAISVNVSAHGEYHESVGKAYYLLAEVFWNATELKAAEPFALKALEIREKVLGPNHLNVAMSLCGLGEIFVDSNPARAQSYLERALKIRLLHFGPNHPLIARILQDLSVIADSQGDPERAVQLCTRACQIREKTLGPMHPHLATSLESLAATYKLKGEPEKAEPLLKRAININNKIHGPVHPSMESCLRWLALVAQDLGRAAEYTRYLRDADLVKEKLAAMNITVGERVDE